MSSWADDAKAGVIPQPPPKAMGNRTFSVTVTFTEGVGTYTQVRKVDMAPGMLVMKFKDREVIVPISSDIREIEISESPILS